MKSEQKLFNRSYFRCYFAIFQLYYPLDSLSACLLLSKSLSLPLRPNTLTPAFKHLEIYLVLSEPYDILYVLEPFHQFHFDFSFNYINFYFEVNACVYIPGKITIIGFIYYLTERKYGSCFRFFFFNFGIEIIWFNAVRRLVFRRTHTIDMLDALF